MNVSLRREPCLLMRRQRVRRVLLGEKQERVKQNQIGWQVLLESADIAVNRTHFDRLKKPIEAALDFSGGTHTFEDVWAMIVNDKAQLWWGVDSVIITEIEETPQLKVMRFFLAGGNLEELEVMYPLIVVWGHSIGCSRAVLVGRKGWDRSFLKKDGWELTHYVFVKECSNGKRFDTNS